ncbi:hypothetical protein [Bdellovibrio sp. HCB337]|uniref:hypothetical protein n=1 Tax=Bdellovibrio sp. HCB337 TaxID=3394358 RepID=UPI0039A62442
MAFKSVILLLGGLLLSPQTSFAYPDFISYGYTACITCHYNGQGNGPLNDYGRALFTTEVASRAIFSDKLSEEEIAAKSGFLGSTELPWWVRPGIKYRGLYFVNNPGSESAVKKYITMQADLNVAVPLDQKMKFLVVLSGGYAPTPASHQGQKDPDDKNFISREHYLRWQVSKALFTYWGTMDKVFGIRTSDHTAYSRVTTGNAQNDQSTGVIAQYYGDGWELTGNGFMGNLAQEKDEELRQKGGSLMYELDTAEKNRIGMAVMSSSNDFVTKNRFEVHSKMGLEKGNSLLTEIGFFNNNPKATPSKEWGGYLMLQGVYLMERGYNVISQIEYMNATMGPESPDLTRWTFGLLAFPMPRVEFRATFVNGRSITDDTVAKDQWMIQTQLHLSL